MLTPAMAKQVYGWIFEGREHLHQNSAMLARFHKAGYGQAPVELPGQQRLMTGAGVPLEGVVADEHGQVVTVREITPADEQLAAEAVALDNAAFAATHDYVVSAPSGVVGSSSPPQERYADPQVYRDQEQMNEVARDRAKQGHGVAAGSQ